VLQISEDRLREGLTRLVEYEFSIYENDTLRQALQALQDLMKRSQGVDDRELDLEHQRTALAVDRQRLAEEQRDFFKSAYEAASKHGHSLGCSVKKVFTLGLGRCG
jgi:hypothetical protein